MTAVRCWDDPSPTRHGAAVAATEGPGADRTAGCPETVARAWWDAHSRLLLAQQRGPGPALGVPDWDQITIPTRQLLIATAADLLDQGVIRA